MWQTVAPQDTAIIARIDEVIADSRTHPYQLFMLVLCIYVLLALAAQTFVALSADAVFILDVVDMAICAVLLADFVGNLALRQDRLAYLKWGWIDLIDHPGGQHFPLGTDRPDNLIVRVLRAVRSTRILAPTSWDAALKARY